MLVYLRRIGFAALLLIPTSLCHAQAAPKRIGIFTGANDVGEVLHAGSVHFDKAKGAYTQTASGENIWALKDGFFYTWKKVSGDVDLSADIVFPKPGGSPYRKAALMIRQSMDADAVYADVALHGGGMTALQYRTDKGVLTKDIELKGDIPQRARIVKHGDEITMFLSMHGKPLQQAGTPVTVHFDGPFYVGLALCAHNPDAVETAIFSQVTLK